jgi:nicotinamide-nucleotide amidase
MDPMASMDIEKVADFLADHDLKVVTAESCTAGLISARLADIPGTGKLLDAAFITYSSRAKEHCLAVNPETIARFNLTSEEVAIEMAKGALKHSDANVAISNTGVVDDTDPAIPAGTQCFAWVFTDAGKHGELGGIFSETRQFSGDRSEIREAAAVYALTRIPELYQSICEGSTSFRKVIQALT